MWSYNDALATDVDRVRLMVGDTVSSDQQFSNEEIQHFLTTTGSLHAAAATACWSLSAKYARYADKWVGDLKILASQKSRAYERLATQFEKKGAIYAVPSAGGVYTADKEAAASNDTLVQGTFRLGLHDNAGG